VLPPLRERREDIGLLVSHFVEVFARRIGKRIGNIPKEILDAFNSYAWPGNVRELQNLIKRAVIRSDHGVLANPFPQFDTNSVGAGPINSNPVVVTSAHAFRDSQRAWILQALHAAGWMIGGPKGAAARLGLKRTTLISKMKKLGIARPVRETKAAPDHSPEAERPWQLAAD
jgi:formate hydrogenlyase transcriptional activator